MGDLHSETNLLPNFQSYFNSLRDRIECLFGCLLNEKARERKPHESFVECIEFENFFGSCIVPKF